MESFFNCSRGPLLTATCLKGYLVFQICIIMFFSRLSRLFVYFNRVNWKTVNSLFHHECPYILQKERWFLWLYTASLNPFSLFLLQFITVIGGSSSSSHQNEAKVTGWTDCWVSRDKVGSFSSWFLFFYFHSPKSEWLCFTFPSSKSTLIELFVCFTQFVLTCMSHNMMAISPAIFLCREIHHFCVLLGYGADGISPYLVFETVVNQRQQGIQ